MKIIIIGFNNIVARHLIDMNIKNKIIIISRKKIFNNPNIIASYDYNDLFDKNKLKKIFNNVNIVINTIGNSINDSKMMEINYSLPKKIINLLINLNNKIHWFQISSLSVYGRASRKKNILMKIALF